jgi:hypothetical protein
VIEHNVHIICGYLPAGVQTQELGSILPNKFQQSYSDQVPYHTGRQRSCEEECKRPRHTENKNKGNQSLLVSALILIHGQSLQ